MADVPTGTNGRCPPRMERVTLYRVAYCIGAGTVADPIRLAVAYYDEEGRHRWSFDDDKLIARNGHDALTA